ncbi:MAG: dipeptidase [Planctomycetaceae bacterium]|nr:dipeptidase [Planctomycetaceae bacterium]
MKRLLAGLICCWVLHAAHPIWAQNAKREPITLTPAALEIHRQSFVFDGHNDLPWELRSRADAGFVKFDIAQPQSTLHTDIARLKQGGVGAQFWSAYVPADTMKTGDALLQTLEQIDLIHRLTRRYAETFELARTVSDIERIRRAGKIASLIGVEGGHSIQNSLSVLRQLHALGVRYMTLTHSDTLDWADAATDTAKSDGLSPFGEEVVREMNRLGMLVDISHVSVATMHDALRISRAPVIASHSSAFAVAQHPRNVPDEILAQLREKDGVVMINFFSGFVDPEGAKIMAKMFDVFRELREKYPDDADFDRAKARWRKEHPIPRGSVHTIVDHIDHVVKIAGIERVGLGSDFDGVSSLPEQLDDVSMYPYITQELLNRGYTAEQIGQINSGNILRVLRKAEQVAAESR